LYFPSSQSQGDTALWPIDGTCDAVAKVVSRNGLFDLLFSSMYESVRLRIIQSESGVDVAGLLSTTEAMYHVFVWQAGGRLVYNTRRLRALRVRCCV